MQETQTDNYVKLKIPGFNILRGDYKRGQWGTAIIIDNNIPIRNLKNFRDNIQDSLIRGSPCFAETLQMAPAKIICLRPFHTKSHPWPIPDSNFTYKKDACQSHIFRY